MSHYALEKAREAAAADPVSTETPPRPVPEPSSARPRSSSWARDVAVVAIGVAAGIALERQVTALLALLFGR